MSDFLQKTLAGLDTTDEEWNRHLIGFHASQPGDTPRFFASWRTPEGLTSYELLAGAIAAMVERAERAERAVILDLACGDGHLTKLLLGRLASGTLLFGVDMAATELAAAKRKLASGSPNLSLARAQALPLRSSTFDAVACHMAFMLMMPVEPVVSELRRVLKSGGVFAAVMNRTPMVGSGDQGDAVLTAVRQASARFLSREYPALKRPRSGDERSMTVEGLHQLFSPRTGFAESIEIKDFELVAEGSVEYVTEFFVSTYLLGALKSETKDRLRAELESVLRGRQAAGAQLQMAFPMRLIVARRQEARPTNR